MIIIKGLGNTKNSLNDIIKNQSKLNNNKNKIKSTQHTQITTVLKKKKKEKKEGRSVA